MRGPFSGSDDAADTTGAFVGRPVAAQTDCRRASSTGARTPCNSAAWIRRCGWRSTAGSKRKLDLDLIAGTEGLLTGSNLGNHNVTSVTTFQHYLSQYLFSRVDGRYAAMKSDIRVLMGSGTYGHAGGVIPGKQQRTKVGAVSARTGVGRRAGVGSRPGRGEP